MNGLNRMNGLSRRLLLGAAGTLLAAGMTRGDVPAPVPGYRFALLGDLHFDRLAHHDQEWLKREKPNDVHQVEDYSRITRDIMPGLFAEVAGRIAEDPGIDFIAHIGDLVEGLAGTPELAKLHCREALSFVDGAKLGRPFLFCKGNHDVTGPGAVEAFNEILLPFISREAKAAAAPAGGANYLTRHGDSLFAWFDAYHPGSLEWLEEAIKTRTERHFFLMIHPPVVPYSARSLWHIFARPAEAERRTRLLNLLGRQKAVVLCGHIHKYGTVVRQTPEGPFIQVAVSSVIPAAATAPRDELTGAGTYGPDVILREPGFSPETAPERRAMLAAEAPHVRYFEYADCPGYGIVRVEGSDISLELYAGLGRKPFRSLPLTRLRDT